MAQLPTDILLLVSSFLTQRDQLECMTVCRRWHDTIYHRSLFHDMFIFSQEQLDKVLDKVKREPHLGKKVGRLTLQMDFEQEYNAEDITRIFPNLRHFAVINTDDYTREDKIITPLQSHPWCEHIETMVDNFSDLNTKTLLYSGLCKNLTYIAMSGRGEDSVRDFIEKLGNAPALKTLYLMRYTMTFYDIDLIHENAPLLDTLLLKAIMCFDTSFAPDIKPATLVKRFQLITTFFDRNTFNVHFPYISQKYTHLEELIFELHQLEPDYVNDEWVDEEYMEEVEEHRERIKSYMKTLAPRLKSFSIFLQAFVGDNAIADFDFNILDECGCQIEKMKLGDGIQPCVVDELAGTNQADYIKSLTINEIYGLSFCISITKSLTYLSFFTALTELTLGYHRATHTRSRPMLDLADLTDILGGCQLETLQLYHVILEFNDSAIYNLCPSLKNLALFDSNFHPGIDVIISQLFPNLKRFVLNNCFQRKGTFMLPQANLSHLEISNAIEHGPLYVLVITSDNGEQRMYSSSKTLVLAGHFLGYVEDNMFSSPSFCSIPYVGSPVIPFLTIVCKSVYSVSLRNSDV